MSMGRLQDSQGELFITPSELPTGEGHVFYEKLNRLLSKHQFDKQVEALCHRYYDDGRRGGRPSLPPGVYFRMNFIGHRQLPRDRLALRKQPGPASLPEHPHHRIHPRPFDLVALASASAAGSA